MGPTRKGLGKECLNGGLNTAPRESHLPETDQVIEGAQGRMERGERWKEAGWLPLRGAMRRGRWQVGNQVDVRGSNWKEVQSTGASQWEQRHGEGGVGKGWQAGGGEQGLLLQPQRLQQGWNFSARLFTVDLAGMG